LIEHSPTYEAKDNLDDGGLPDDRIIEKDEVRDSPTFSNHVRASRRLHMVIISGIRVIDRLPVVNATTLVAKDLNPSALFRGWICVDIFFATVQRLFQGSTACNTLPLFLESLVSILQDQLTGLLMVGKLKRSFKVLTRF
jgi:hypothetical protein